MASRYHSGTVLSHEALEDLADLFGIEDDLPRSVRDAVKEFESDRREWDGDAPGEE